MAATTKKDVLKLVKQHDIKFIKLWFTDVLGFQKGISITRRELEKAMEDGMGFDGSSIEGFARIEESDMVAMPDVSTFRLIPWRTDADGLSARMFCDIINPNGKPFEGDPRYVFKKNLKKAKDLGFTYYIGPELEYFYFENPKNTIILDRAGYFDLTPLDVAQDLRRETVIMLEKMGVEVEYSHHEVATSQHEIDLKYCEALNMADKVMTYRMVVKEVARQHGKYATFMPKPMYGVNGSGMHVHQSLFKGSKNAFFSKTDKSHLSDMAKHFIAGILKHVPEITAVTNQWVNSYKRLIPGYEAPVYVCWAQMNRSALVRVPMYKPGKENATRIELRSPDPAANPYLAFSVMLAAGLDGIKKKSKLPKASEDNIYEMTEKGREEAGIESLPEDLYEAIKLTEKSALVKEALGDKLFEYFIRNKYMEWDEYKAQVSKYEIDKYLPIL